MNTTVKDVSNPRLNTIFLGVAFFWSVVIVALATWNYWQSYTSTVEVARSSANQSYSKDLTYRSWATKHGGVYAPITPETPPNPYLSDIPERDISTPSGKKLTLINPAYMTRQVHELGEKDFGMIGHITSMKPIRPENVPDEWEKSALQTFERGQKEVSALSPIGNETYLRFMRPLITEPGCLKCHAKQGYKVGDIRGGISVSLPWTPFRAALRSILLVIILGYGGIWTIGILGLYLGRKRLNNHLSKRKRAEEALRESEESKRRLLHAAGDGIFGVDATGQLTFVNPAALRMLGFTEQEILGQAGQRVHALIHHSHADGSKYSVDDCPMYASYTHGTDHYIKDEVLWRKDGSSFPVEYSSMAIIQDSKIMGAVVTFKDITERKRVEKALQEEHRQLQQALDEIRTLRGILPICAYCKKIRDDEGYWDHVEKYVSAHTDAKFSHGICPECFEREMKGIETSD